MSKLIDRLRLELEVQNKKKIVRKTGKSKAIKSSKDPIARAEENVSKFYSGQPQDIVAKLIRKGELSFFNTHFARIYEKYLKGIKNISPEEFNILFKKYVNESGLLAPFQRMAKAEKRERVRMERNRRTLDDELRDANLTKENELKARMEAASKLSLNKFVKEMVAKSKRIKKEQIALNRASIKEQLRITNLIEKFGDKSSYVNERDEISAILEKYEELKAKYYNIEDLESEDKLSALKELDEFESSLQERIAQVYESQRKLEQDAKDLYDKELEPFREKKDMALAKINELQYDNALINLSLDNLDREYSELSRMLGVEENLENLEEKQENLEEKQDKKLKILKENMSDLYEIKEGLEKLVKENKQQIVELEEIVREQDEKLNEFENEIEEKLKKEYNLWSEKNLEIRLAKIEENLRESLNVYEDYGEENENKVDNGIDLSPEILYKAINKNYDKFDEVFKNRLDVMDDSKACVDDLVNKGILSSNRSIINDEKSGELYYNLIKEEFPDIKISSELRLPNVLAEVLDRASSKKDLTINNLIGDMSTYKIGFKSILDKSSSLQEVMENIRAGVDIAYPKSQEIAEAAVLADNGGHTHYSPKMLFPIIERGIIYYMVNNYLNDSSSNLPGSFSSDLITLDEENILKQMERLQLLPPRVREKGADSYSINKKIKEIKKTKKFDLPSKEELAKATANKFKGKIGAFESKDLLNLLSQGYLNFLEQIETGKSEEKKEELEDIELTKENILDQMNKLGLNFEKIVQEGGSSKLTELFNKTVADSSLKVAEASNLRIAELTYEAFKDSKQTFSSDELLSLLTEGYYNFLVGIDDDFSSIEGNGIDYFSEAYPWHCIHRQTGCSKAKDMMDKIDKKMRADPNHDHVMDQRRMLLGSGIHDRKYMLYLGSYAAGNNNRKLLKKLHLR